MRSFRRLGASWLARGVALSLITSSIALGPAHPAAAATGDPFRFIYDQDGRLRAAVTPTDSAKWTYDAVGNITAISRQAATTLSVIEFASHAGPVGATVHIYGTAFSTTPGSNTVKFNGTLATVSSSTTTEIVTTVPSGATSGTISVKVGNTTATSTDSFTVQGAIAPTIASFTPARAAAGSTLTVTGTNFDTLLTNNQATIADTFGRVTAATSTSMSLVVPPFATSGKIKVATVNGIATSSVDFFAPPPGYAVSDVDPTGRLTFGSPLTFNFAGTARFGLELFDGTMGQRISLLLSRTGIPGGYILSIRGPDGANLYGPVTGTPTFIDTTVLPLTGTYTVIVDTVSPSAGSVTATVYDVGADPSATLTSGGPAQTVNVTVPGQDARFSFSGTAGRKASLTVSRTGVPNGYALSITNPDGTALYGPQNGTPSFVDATVLPQTGTYGVRADVGNGETGTVTAQLFDVVDTTGTLTAGGAAVTLTIGTPGQNAIYTFSGTNGQRISLSLSRTGLPTGYFLSIKNPDGSYLYGPSGGTPSFVDVTPLTQTGTFTVLVDAGNADTGTVTAQLYDVPADASGTLVIGGSGVTLQVTTPGQNAVYSFDGVTGDALTVTLSSTLSQGYFLSVKNPDGTYLYGPQGGTPSSASFTLTQTGTHIILVDAAGTGTGSVTATLARTGGALPALPVVAAMRDRGSAHAALAFLAADRVLTEVADGSISGYVHAATGEPLANVRVGIAQTETLTDATGRFALSAVPSGHQQLWVDGRAARANQDYGQFEIGIDVPAGGALELPFTIWLTRTDDAHAITIASPTVGEVVLTSPKIKGLEVHLAPGTVITDDDGNVVHELSLTQLDQARPPFPLPPLVQTPVYFTVQPGRTYLSKPARIYYPAPAGAKPGTRAQFWHYDPDARGWYVYGWGQVTADGTQVVPDPGVAVYDLSASMIHFPGMILAGLWAAVGDFFSGGDPVDLGTGLFELDKTDLVEQDIAPITLSRTYRQLDNVSRPFGIGTTHSYAVFLSSQNPYQEVDLILPDGGRVHYVRTSPGTGYQDAVFEHTATPTRFYKSKIIWIPGGWQLTMKDGTQLVFDYTGLRAIVDRFGNRTTLAADGSNRIATIRSPNGRWIQLSYDGSNRISSAQDNVGRTVGYTYDASGRLWKVTDPAGKITEFGYDTSNRLTTIKDPRLITFLTNVYDPISGRVTQQTQVDGGIFQYAYTVDPGTGKVTQTNVTDPRNFVRRVLFNSSGYGTSDTVAFGLSEAQTTAYERDPASNLVLSVTDARGRVTHNTYDATANLLTTTSLYGTPNAVNTTFTYTPTFNDIATVADPLTHSTTFGYDSLGNRQSESDALQHQTTFTSYPSGQLHTATNALQKTTTLAYQNGDLLSVTDPLGRITKRFSDAAGRPVFATDALGSQTRTDYDDLNRVTQVSDPRAGATLFTYDESGNRLTLKDSRLNVTTYTYDNMDQLATRKDALLHTETYTYDTAGELLTVTDRKGQVSEFRYDSLGRQSFAGFGRTGTAPTFSYDSTINYTYDNGNRLTQAQDSANGTITRGYDELDRLTSETSPQGIVGYQYDSAGRRTQFQVTGQSALTYGYDDADRLLSITQGSTIVGFGYDNADRRTSLTLPGNLSVLYGYDDASQLLSLTYQHSGSTIGDLAYTYDAAGRRATTTGGYARLNLPAAVTSAIYNANNQLTKWGNTSLSYDLNGNMLGDGNNTYNWNARDQLSSVTQSHATLPAFTYDAFGRRQKKTLGSAVTSYLYDGANTVQELAGASPSANILTGLGVDEVFQRTEGSTTRAFLSDALGSALALADSSGAVQTSYTYAPYGDTTASGATSNNTSDFTGRENDADGLYYYRARYYNPVFSRFVTEDPLEFGAGDPDLFGYVRNSPTNFVDPNGTILPWIGACAGGAAFNAALTLGSNVLAGRKNTLSQTLSSALIGCAFGLAVLGVGPLFAAVLRPALTAAALGPTRVAFPIVGRVLTGYTKHGIEQAILNDGVGVAPRAILDAVRDPLRVIAQSGGRQLFVGRDAAVVLNAAGKVITTWARSHAGWRMP